jgi:hypothetical protein
MIPGDTWPTDHGYLVWHCDRCDYRAALPDQAGKHAELAHVVRTEGNVFAAGMHHAAVHGPRGEAHQDGSEG